MSSRVAPTSLKQSGDQYVVARSQRRRKHFVLGSESWRRSADAFHGREGASSQLRAPWSDREATGGTLHRLKRDITSSRSFDPARDYPEDVANLVLFLASEEARFITSEMINVDGGDRLRTICLLFIRLINIRSIQLLTFQRNCFLFAIAIRPEFGRLLIISSLRQTNNSVDRLRTICLLFIRLINTTQLLTFQRNCFLFAIAIRPES